MTADTYNMTAVCKTLGTANRTLYAVMDEIGVHGVKTSGGRLFTQAEVLQLGAGLDARRCQAAKVPVPRQEDFDHERQAVVWCWVYGLRVRVVARILRLTPRAVGHLLDQPYPYHGAPRARCRICQQPLAAHRRCHACGLLLGPGHEDSGTQRAGWSGHLCRNCATPRRDRVGEHVATYACPAVHEGRVVRGV